MVFSYGGCVAAAQMLRGQWKESSPIHVNIEPETDIHIHMDSEDIKLKYEMGTDSDWARAAWALIKACETNGQTEALKNLLKADACGLVSEKSDIGKDG